MAYELSPVDLKVIHVKTTEELLERIPIMDGAIYLCTDTGNLYYDVDEERKKILSNIIEIIRSDLDSSTNAISNIRSDMENIRSDMVEQYNESYAAIEQIKSDFEKYIKTKEFIDEYMVWYTYSDTEEEPEEDEPVPEEFDEYLFWYLYSD